jgi:hypothetical protein
MKKVMHPSVIWMSSPKVGAVKDALSLPPEWPLCKVVKTTCFEGQDRFGSKKDKRFVLKKTRGLF